MLSGTSRPSPPSTRTCSTMPATGLLVEEKIDEQNFRVPTPRVGDAGKKYKLTPKNQFKIHGKVPTKLILN